MDRLKRALRWAIGLGLVGFLLARFDLGDVLHRAANADLRLLVPALAGLVAVHVLGALAWWRIDQRLNHDRMRWRTALRTYYIAQGIGGLTPANLGSDAYRLYAAGGSRWRRGLAPIVMQRVTSSAALAILAVVALSWLPLGPGVAVLASAVAVIGLVLAVAAVPFLNRLPGLRMPTGNGQGGPSVRARPRDVASSAATGVVLGMAFHVASVGLAFVVLRAVSPVANPLPTMACLVVARLSILVPVSPSGLGIQEGALALLLPAVGVPVEIALAAALLNRLGTVLVAAVGGALLAWPEVLQTRDRWSRPAPSQRPATRQRDALRHDA